MVDAREEGVGLGDDYGEFIVFLRVGCCVAKLRDDDAVRRGWTLHVGFNFGHGLSPIYMVLF